MTSTADVRTVDDLEALADIISSNAKIIKSFFIQEQIPNLSFHQDSPLGFPEAPSNVQEARETLLDASRKINQLVNGPMEHLFWHSVAVSTIL